MAYKRGIWTGFEKTRAEVVTTIIIRFEQWLDLKCFGATKPVSYHRESNDLTVFSEGGDYL